MVTIRILFILLILNEISIAQGLFGDIYPIGEDISMGYKTNLRPDLETMIFEANPNVRLPFWNNFRERFMNQNTIDKRYGSSLLLSFNPQIRMYNDSSKPVKMPSYKIGLGYQHMRLLSHSMEKVTFLSFSYETGHYSNGQTGCSFCPEFEDGTAECDSIYSLINDNTNLSDILNRRNGNFSTNFTELAINIGRMNKDEDEIVKNSLQAMLKFEMYHNNLLYLVNLGGYSANDIKIYGRYRFSLSIEYSDSLKLGNFSKRTGLNRYTVSAKVQVISKPHKSVNPLRLETSGTVYFDNNLGLFAAFIYGHDNYNYRFVDSGFQFFIGFKKEIFPPIQFTSPI